jgi:cytosine/adenosine deaminase-related metal-dependent hydrolase
MAKTLLVKHCHTLVTMDAGRRELRDGALFIRDGVIEQVGLSAELPTEADEILDLKGRYVVLPGLINTHHHFYQTLTRAIPSVQNAELFDWLVGLYPIWANLTPRHIAVSSQVCAAELMLSGCTTASDHHYIFPNDCRLDDQIQAIAQTGLRFHASRGSMSVGQSQGGLPPDRVVEDEAFILKDMQRLVEEYHDPARHAMLRITLAPCSPFSVSPTLMRQTAEMARAYGVRLHTHLAETKPDVAYSLEKFGLLPGDYAEDVGWVGEDVWHAHCVHLSDNAIQLFGRTETGVAHCPSSNMRLGSGIPRIRQMLDAGVPVGLGVDGSASNDHNHLLTEARMAMLLARVQGEANPAAMTARQALELATLGGARVLGRNDVGALAPGMAADFIAFNLDRLEFAGAGHDAVAALLFCHAGPVDYSFINGRKVVDTGRLTTLDLPPLIEQHNQLAQTLVDGR